MKGTYAGLGVTFGAGLGLVAGILFLDAWWFGMVIGAVLGLVIGSLAEIASRDRGSGGGA